MTGKGVGSIESYPAPYRDEQETCQTGVSAVDTGRELHCRGIGVLGEGAAEEAEKPSHKCGTPFPGKAFSMRVEWEERAGCQGVFVI